MQAMLLAAGFGTRLRPYSLIRPKPLFPVVNRPLLHILMDMLVRAGCSRVVVNCHHLAEQVRTAVQGYQVLLQEEGDLLGTGGSLRQALEHFDDRPLLVMNGDICHDVDLRQLYQAHMSGGGGVTMAMHDCPRFNTVVVSGDRVIGFVDRPRPDCLAFTGIQVVDPEVIAMIPAGRFYHIIDLYRQLAAHGQVRSLRLDDCFWRDMGTPEDYLDLHRDLLARPRFSWQPEQDRRSWCIHPGARVASGAVLTGWGVIGAGAVVGDCASLRDCVVWDGAVVARAGRHRREILT